MVDCLKTTPLIFPKVTLRIGSSVDTWIAGPRLLIFQTNSDLSEKTQQIFLLLPTVGSPDCIFERKLATFSGQPISETIMGLILGYLKAQPTSLQSSRISGTFGKFSVELLIGLSCPSDDETVS